MFVPQGFDEMKTVKSKLDRLSGNEATNKDISRVSTNLYFHDQNASAAKLIGIAANHNVANAVLQFHDVRLNESNPNNHFILNGKSLRSLSNKHTERELTIKHNNNRRTPFEIGSISRRVSQPLAASVDAVKDPVLASFNLDINTINVGMMLLRLGHTIEEVGVFLNQPILKEFTRMSALETHPDKAAIIQNLINNYRQDSGKIKSTGLMLKDLEKAIITKGEGMAELQAEVGSNFAMMLESADVVNDLTNILKADSSSSSAGPGIVDTVSKLNKIQKIKNDSLMPNPILLGVSRLFVMGDT